MAAPSGKFCSPMPMASATAPGRAAAPPSRAATAKARPTAMPSGMLCSVTASTTMVVRFRWAGGPSGSSLPMCRWGSRRSSSIRNTPPSTKPPPAASSALWPCSSAISMAGMSSDHTDAAIITPAAKPRKARCSPAPMSFLNKNTVPAPSTVAKQVAPVPSIAKYNSRESMRFSFFARQAPRYSPPPRAANAARSSAAFTIHYRRAHFNLICRSKAGIICKRYTSL